EISLALSLSGLLQRGIEVRALLPGPGELAAALERRAIPSDFAPQDTLRRGGSVRFLLRPHPDWMAVVRRFRPDVIHCNAVRSALYGQAVGRAVGVPVVFHARTATPDPWFDHFLTAVTARIICTSTAVRQRFPDWLGSDRLVV